MLMFHEVTYANWCQVLVALCYSFTFIFVQLLCSLFVLGAINYYYFIYVPACLLSSFFFVQFPSEKRMQIFVRNEKVLFMGMIQ